MLKYIFSKQQQKNTNKLIQSLFYILCIISPILALSQTPKPNGTLSPSQGDEYCPGVTNTRNFTLSLTNVVNTDVRVQLENKLKVTNLTVSNNNELIVTLWFEDQNLITPQLQFKRYSDGVFFETTFEFPHLL